MKTFAAIFAAFTLLSFSTPPAKAAQIVLTCPAPTGSIIKVKPASAVSRATPFTLLSRTPRFRSRLRGRATIACD